MKAKILFKISSLSLFQCSNLDSKQIPILFMPRNVTRKGTENSVHKIQAAAEIQECEFILDRKKDIFLAG